MPVKHLRDGDGREVSSAAVEQLRASSGSRKSHDASAQRPRRKPCQYSFLAIDGSARVEFIKSLLLTSLEAEDHDLCACRRTARMMARGL